MTKANVKVQLHLLPMAGQDVIVIGLNLVLIFNTSL